MESIIVLIVEQDVCRLARSLSEEVALTLIAAASEDPASWEDITIRRAPATGEATDRPFGRRQAAVAQRTL